MERVIQQRALLLKEDEDLLARTADSKALEDTLHRLREYMKQHAPGKLGAVDHDTAKRVRDDLAARLEILQALPESLPAAPTRKRKVKASAQDSSTDTEILVLQRQVVIGVVGVSEVFLVVCGVVVWSCGKIFRVGWRILRRSPLGWRGGFHGWNRGGRRWPICVGC